MKVMAEKLLKRDSTPSDTVCLSPHGFENFIDAAFSLLRSIHAYIYATLFHATTLLCSRLNCPISWI